MIPRFGDGRDWFFEKRFGLFVHWGIYAIPGQHEQHQFRFGVPRREYEKFMHQFNPAQFDPDAWLDLAAQVGMEYVCFTTKHIDGFCMWNTAQTSFNIMNTPYGKDVLRMLAEACHRRGFPLCLYYSCVDMHHPNYPNAGRSYELPKPDPGDEPDFDRYMAFVRAQVRELCSNYGEIHGFWWDANMTGHHDPSMNEMIRRMQPKAVINNRGYDDGDFGTPERESDHANAQIQASLHFTRPTEACNSVGVHSWGYRSNEDYYCTRHLIDSMDVVMAKGGNYLLNLGPDSLGRIPTEAATRLRRIGEWYGKVREAFGSCEPASDLLTCPGVYLTRKDSTLYVHLYGQPCSEAVILPPIHALPRRAILLNTGEQLEARAEWLPKFYLQKEPFLRLRNLPLDRLADQVLVARLDFDPADMEKILAAAARA